MLPDSHLHVTGRPRNHSCGVGPLFINGTRESDWQAVINTAMARGGTPFIGLHPWFIESADYGWMERLNDCVSSTRVGLGEIGLDKFRGPSAEEQEVALRGQLDIAMVLNRPVSLHCVKRWGPLLSILQHYAPHCRRVMIHGFNGSLEVMNELTALGCRVSIGLELILDNPRVAGLWDALPLEFALLESDAPDGMASRHFFQKGISYSDAMHSLYEAAAVIKGLCVADLEHCISHTMRRFSEIERLH